MQEIVLYIKDTDGNYQQAEMFGDENVTITSKIQDVRDIGAVFTDYSQSFSLPASKTNNKIFKHWYNYNIDDGFDTRIKVDALIEIDHLPFRRGKIALRNVKMKDNQASSYSVVFFGNTVRLKDLMGDDELKDLPYLDNYNHSYTAGQVYDGLTEGLNENSVADSIIYPLITHTKRLYFDSTDYNINGGFIGHYGTSGTAATGTSELSDSSATFTSTINEVTPPVAVGDFVYNFTDDTFALVTQVNSATKLILDKEIFDGASSTYYIFQNIQYSGNLFRDGYQKSRGLSYIDIKPAILCSEIIKAIENKYDIEFTTDFISTDAFSNLYMWLHRNKGTLNSGREDEETKIIGDWTYSTGDDIFDIESGDDPQNNGTNWIVNVAGESREIYSAVLTVTPSSEYTDIKYKIEAVDSISGEILAAKDNLEGTNTLSFVLEVEEPEPITYYDITWQVTSVGTLEFVPSLTLTYEEVDDGSTTTQTGTYVSSPATLTTLTEIIVKNQVPKIKCIDFLTGLFKMFNLTAYYIDDVGDADFGKIKLQTLDDFYADAINNPSGGRYDISKHIDITNSEVEAAINYNRVEFKYQEPSTIVAQNHEERFNQVFGDEYFELTSIDKSEIYDIELPFEHMKFERLFDQNVSLRATGTTTSAATDKLIDSTASFTTTVKVGDLVKRSSNDTRATITAIDSDTQLSLSDDIMGASTDYDIENEDRLTEILYGYSADGEFTSDIDVNPATGNYDPVLTKPLLFYGILETISDGQKNINWIDVDSDSNPAPNNIQAYFRPSNTNSTGTSTIFPDYTLNFDNEVDEWTLTDYDGNSNSLFRNFWANYIKDLFSQKKRIFKISAYLPTDILINYRLNDKLVIQDREFLINSIKTNLMTERSELELVNETEKTYYEIQLRYDFSGNNCGSGTLVTVYSDVPAVSFGSETTGKIYSNKGLSIYAPNGKYSNGTNYDTWYADGNTPTTPSLREQGWWESEYDESVTYPLICGGGS
jgi:hypothetical protein